MPTFEAEPHPESTFMLLRGYFRLTWWLLSLPAAGVVVLGYTAWVSLTDRTLLNPHSHFIGLDNYTALFHDSAKPLTLQGDPTTGRITSPKHAVKGEHLARASLRDLGCDLATREEVARLVRYHGRPAFLLEKPDPAGRGHPGGTRTESGTPADGPVVRLQRHEPAAADPKAMDRPVRRL